MCGRFTLTLPSDALAQLFGAVPANDLPYVPNYNICPTVQVHVVRPGEPGRRLVSMRWGFLPFWAKSPTDGPLLINARAETIAEKPAFRSAARDRRCLIPASGFYEWTKAEDGKRLPWYIRPRDDRVLAFGGIWQPWGKDEERIDTCAIVTVPAGPDVEPIHNRQPLIIEKDDWPLWLGEAGKGAARLMKPSPEGTLTAYRVDPKVNSNRARGPELIEPIEPTETA